MAVKLFLEGKIECRTEKSNSKNLPDQGTVIKKQSYISLFVKVKGKTKFNKGKSNFSKRKSKSFNSQIKRKE